MISFEMLDVTELAKSILFTLGILGVALGFFGAVWVYAISRNPEGSEKMFMPGLFILSCIEISSLACIGVLMLKL
jgi:F0F1-type ATP synthase membrane subunit c/vacuolar-type H+-ATPase subunit K